MEISQLEEILTGASSHLKHLTSKKMFGCHALWADGNVFALVWKKGRIGVKLPQEKTYNSLMKIDGAEPWKAGAMTMSHWVLVPETFHKKPATLKKWAETAYDECKVLPKKAVKKKSPIAAGKKKSS
jgi:TfoX/Sxy family transcriptional regulator of competence genes